MKRLSMPNFLAWKAEGAVRDREGGSARWLRDPLSHPDIEAMSERERADLPFPRGRSQSEDRAACS